MDGIGTSEKVAVIAGNGSAWNRQISTFLSLVQNGVENGYVSPEISSSMLQTVLRSSSAWKEFDPGSGGDFSKLDLMHVQDDVQSLHKLKQNPLKCFQMAE